MERLALIQFFRKSTVFEAVLFSVFTYFSLQNSHSVKYIPAGLQGR